jgi:hypothetical protein
MPGQNFTEAEILALLNEGRPPGATAFTSPINAIYGGSPPAGAVTDAQRLTENELSDFSRL